MSAFGHRLFKAVNVHPSCTCSGGLCKAPVTFLAQYDYVTGRAGRITNADKWLCEEHGRAFAARHNAKVRGQVDHSKFYGDRQQAFQQLLALPEEARAK